MHDEMENTEKAEEVEEVEIEEKAEEQGTVDEETFYVRSSQGVSINGVGFCRGRYKLGQLVGIITIDKDVMNNILSLDTASIATNPHLLM